ncbi:protein-disulfide reductase DsbD family protein [Sorangium sp. So ce854]|uniref:protein-disulfide reductase DsbD family protein n=1 Tax=Sorangium sp. So ce854 TaxID=3133322 RepID=UPI003F622EAD
MTASTRLQGSAGAAPAGLQRGARGTRGMPRNALLSLVALAVLASPGLALAADEPDLFTRGLQAGPLFAALAALAGGLLTCLTPCVYPMIAITVSIFGAREAKSRREAMLLSTSFVLGIVVLFTAMLVVAALTGSLFGSVLANRWVIVGIAMVFIALSLSMFGAFEMTLPDALMQRLSQVGGIGYGGAFLLGLVSGLVAAPCTGPVLTGIILWIGKTQNIGLGALVGATFSLGLGLPFWLVGTFAVALPKGGKWMLGVKSFFGIVMLVVALYFLKTTFPALSALARPTPQFMAAMAGLVVVGLALGAVHLAWDDGGLGVKIRKGLGIALTVTCGFLLVASLDLPRLASPVPAAVAGEPAPGQLTWLHEEPVAAAKAKAEKRPLLVDFTADWCGACKQLDKDTFSDPRVMARAAHFVAVKVDATNDEDPQVGAVMGKYKVVGLPTVVIYDSTGAERKRFNDFVGPDVFLAALEGIE